MTTGTVLFTGTYSASGSIVRLAYAGAGTSDAALSGTTLTQADSDGNVFVYRK